MVSVIMPLHRPGTMVDVAISAVLAQTWHNLELIVVVDGGPAELPPVIERWAAMDARMRVQSYAVWSIVVFTLNVLAFMLMGMQARRIWLSLSSSELVHACKFAALVVLAITIIRMPYSRRLSNTIHSRPARRLCHLK